MEPPSFCTTTTTTTNLSFLSFLSPPPTRKQVLDDNKVLTLANGDRIQMTMAMKAMFEAENLNNASPATVSRAGIIFVSDTELGWKPVVMSWLQNSMRNQEREILRALFDKYIDPLLDHIRIHCRPVMFNQAVCTVAQLCTLMDGCLKASMAANEILSESHYERLFVYCMCWSLGALLSPKDRESFDKEVRKQCENLPMKMAEGETLFDYMVDDTSTEWVSWKNLVPVWKYPMGVEKPEFASLVIPTMDSVRLEKILQLCHSVNRPTLLVGGAGTAKTTTIQQFLRSFDPEVMFTKGITFSYLTTPRIFQSSVEGLIEKRQGRTFGPPGGKKMILFIDDLSMPKINEWGDQITNEIVRQLLELAGFYSLEKPIGDMKYVVDANYVAAMIAPGGGKNDIPNRLKRQFTCVNVPLPSKAAIEGIFGTLMAGRFEPSSFDVSVCELAGKLVPMTMQLWQTVQLKILPTPAKFHVSAACNHEAFLFSFSFYMLVSKRNCERKTLTISIFIMPNKSPNLHTQRSLRTDLFPLSLPLSLVPFPCAVHVQHPRAVQGVPGHHPGLPGPLQEGRDGRPRRQG